MRWEEAPVCPACIATATLVVAGGGWAGVTALVVKGPARDGRERGYQLCRVYPGAQGVT
jgi:hypothetical protein